MAKPQTELKATPTTLAPAVGTEWLGGYYITSFTDYGVGLAQLPNTHDDVFGWIRGADKKQNQCKNFVDGDGKICQSDFLEGKDQAKDLKLPAGVRGIDSVIAAYISTHGNRSASTVTPATFCFLIGDGKSVFNTNMTLGDGSLRYLFLATCDSVPLADPGSVWWAATKGLRAVFGYDDAIADSPFYGAYFFQELLKNPSNTMTQAFLDASWRVSPYQAPVAAWFGTSASTANSALNNERLFLDKKVNKAKYISWKYYAAQPIPPSIGQLVLRGAPISFTDPTPVTDPAAVLAPFMSDEAAARVRALSPVEYHGNNHSYVAQDGTVLVWNALSGSLDITFANFREPSLFESSDGDAIAAATRYLEQVRDAIPGARSGVPWLDLGFTAATLRRTMVASSDKHRVAPAVVSQMTVIFRQTVNGVPTVGAGGVVEITLNGGLKVSRVRMVIRPLVIQDHPSPLAPVINVDALRSRAKERALTEFQTAANQCEVTEAEFGYFAADEDVTQQTSEPCFRVVVKVTAPEMLVQGGEYPHVEQAPVPMQFTRLFERIYTTNQLNGPQGS